MSPPSDWNESREHLHSEVNRNAQGLEELRTTVVKQQLSTIEALNRQTTEITRRINDNHVETIERVNESEKSQTAEVQKLAAGLRHDITKISSELLAMKVKVSTWGALAGLLASALLKLVLK